MKVAITYSGQAVTEIDADALADFLGDSPTDKAIDDAINEQINEFGDYSITASITTPTRRILHEKVHAAIARRDNER